MILSVHELLEKQLVGKKLVRSITYPDHHSEVFGKTIIGVSIRTWDFDEGKGDPMVALQVSPTLTYHVEEDEQIEIE